jgi:hypothetical protein
VGRGGGGLGDGVRKGKGGGIEAEGRPADATIKGCRVLTDRRGLRMERDGLGVSRGSYCCIYSRYSTISQYCDKFTLSIPELAKTRAAKIWSRKCE